MYFCTFVDGQQEVSLSSENFIDWNDAFQKAVLSLMPEADSPVPSIMNVAVAIMRQNAGITEAVRTEIDYKNILLNTDWSEVEQARALREAGRTGRRGGSRGRRSALLTQTEPVEASDSCDCPACRGEVEEEPVSRSAIPPPFVSRGSWTMSGFRPVEEEAEREEEEVGA